jgi:hypothetical protein
MIVLKEFKIRVQLVVFCFESLYKNKFKLVSMHSTEQRTDFFS